MRSIRPALALFGAQLLLAGAAQATTLVTAPLLRVANEELTCLVVNAGASDVEVDLRVMTTLGGWGGGYTYTLSPGESRSTTSNAIAHDHCEFRFSGSPKRVRAIACTGFENAGCRAVTPAE